MKLISLKTLINIVNKYFDFLNMAYDLGLFGQEYSNLNSRPPLADKNPPSKKTP